MHIFSHLIDLMRLFRVFRLPQHSRYNYIPRYYDPDKEAFEDRMKKLKMQQEDSPEAMKSRITDGLRRGRGDRSYRKRSILRSNLIVLGTIVILGILAILFINYYLPRILESLG